VENPIPTSIIDLERAALGARPPARRRGGEERFLRWAVGAEADQQRDERLNFANLQGERGALTLDQLEHGSPTWRPSLSSPSPRRSG
jgi:hypothetical protein